MVKHSAHFTNALNKEKERLQKRLIAARKKYLKAEADLDSLTAQINEIDKQLGIEPELPTQQQAGDVDMNVALAA